MIGNFGVVLSLRERPRAETERADPDPTLWATRKRWVVTRRRRSAHVGSGALSFVVRYEVARLSGGRWLGGYNQLVSTDYWVSLR